ncbi:hypothetical protein EVAR_24524_1 [Eumeta japonica]|uniref:Uncharacterized protein n=1 Tax=Eumeta variegata TaxID=151549 RepID=A0A4C1UQX7_EUMVA|nr:hypothetical protein EVAR_24524_1 [Eumeta japonica]
MDGHRRRGDSVSLADDAASINQEPGLERIENVTGVETEGLIGIKIISVAGMETRNNTGTRFKNALRADTRRRVRHLRDFQRSIIRLHRYCE